jgi:hypothetical protein
MATIEIGGRALDVRECSIGFWRRFKALGQGQDDAAAVDKIVGLFFESIEHNEGVTREWLEDHLPMASASLNAKFSELLVAGGLAPKEKPAEGEPQAR